MLIVRKFLRDIPAVLGFVIIAAVILLALLGPMIVPRPDAVFDSNILMRLRPPSDEFWFGTDNLGRDVFSRVILGARGALLVALSTVAIAMAIGVPAGLYAGYTDGWGSEAVMRVTDVFLAVPQLILALAIAQLIGRGLESAMLALALTYWPFFCRTIYAETATPPVRNSAIGPRSTLRPPATGPVVLKLPLPSRSTVNSAWSGSPVAGSPRPPSACATRLPSPASCARCAAFGSKRKPSTAPSAPSVTKALSRPVVSPLPPAPGLSCVSTRITGRRGFQQRLREVRLLQCDAACQRVRSRIGLLLPRRMHHH